MNLNILILTDYKGFFGSKQLSQIYRGGMDIPELLKLFNENDFNARAIKIAELNINDVVLNRPFILYTSSEDKNGFYKSYIEDVIYHLEKSGVNTIPRFEHLKAHNNKVAMELLRERSKYKPIQTIKSKVFGSLAELQNNVNTLEYPVVIKAAAGAMSKGVSKADSPQELIRAAKKISNSKSYRHDSKEFLRSIKYRKKYVKESFHRKKFIVQNLISNLSNDWKVLVYGNRCYALYRGVRNGDFRASGSGNFEFRKEMPAGMLDYAQAVKNHFNVPNISLDIGYDGKTFHLIEFQFLYFGTTTLEKSPFYFERINGQWILVEKKSILEEVYVRSIVDHLTHN